MEDKDVYREKMEAKLREWNAQLSELNAKMDQAKADAKIEYQKKIEDFRIKKEALEEKMDELKSAGGEAWQKNQDRIGKGGIRPAQRSG